VEVVILALSFSQARIRTSYHPDIHYHYRIIPMKVKWQSRKKPVHARCLTPNGPTWPPARTQFFRVSRLLLAILVHLCDNYPGHGKVVHLVPFLFHELSSILFRKRKSMSLPFGLPPLIARTPFVSPKLGIIKHKRVYQPGKQGARLHGVFASRHLHLSKHPIFVPPSFFLICLFNRLFNLASQIRKSNSPVYGALCLSPMVSRSIL